MAEGVSSVGGTGVGNGRVGEAVAVDRGVVVGTAVAVAVAVGIGRGVCVEAGTGNFVAVAVAVGWEERGTAVASSMTIVTAAWV